MCSTAAVISSLILGYRADFGSVCAESPPIPLALGDRVRTPLPDPERKAGAVAERFGSLGISETTERFDFFDCIELKSVGNLWRNADDVRSVRN